MCWGALVGSYFGTIPSGHDVFSIFAQKVKKIDATNMEEMMKISIYIGIFHICLANIMVAWKYKNSLYSLSKIGWALISLSGIIFIPYIMLGEKKSAHKEEIALYMLIIGLSLIFLFTSKSKNFFKRGFDGLLGLTKISSIFGDILSYLRIFALGLASASLGMTFNQLSTQVVETFPIIGYVMAFIILLVGHSINFGLGIISGVVHGLRLNVIEFFNWSISDEGYPFNAFSKTEVKKWIKL
jgi:V/A-type H+-transporting ATPase subunit I